MEERIYIEAELMYKKASDFKTIEGDLRKWAGTIKTINNEYLTINIEIPESFPMDPPNIKVNPPIIHPKIDKIGKIDIQLLRNWNPEYHIYQIINSLKALFWRELPQKMENVKKVLEKDQNMEIKNAESQKIESNNSITNLNISKQEIEDKIQISLDEAPLFLKDKILDLLSDKISLINLIEYVDEFFQKGELSSENYSKLYKKYYNVLILINEDLKKINNKQ